MLLDAYYHVVDLVGTLLNKETLVDTDDDAFDLFCKHAKIGRVAKNRGGVEIEYQYISPKDMPELLHKIFSGKPDLKPIDPAKLVNDLWQDKNIHTGEEVDTMI